MLSALLKKYLPWEKGSRIPVSVCSVPTLLLLRHSYVEEQNYFYKTDKIRMVEDLIKWDNSEKSFFISSEQNVICELFDSVVPG